MFKFLKILFISLCLNFLNFIHIVVFDVKTALKNAKLMILDWLELHFYYHLPFMVGADYKITLRKIFRYFRKSKMSSMYLIVLS